MPSESNKQKQPGGDGGQQAASGPKADSASTTGTGGIVPNAIKVITAPDPEENVVEGQNSLGQGTETSVRCHVHKESITAYGRSTLAIEEDMVQAVQTAMAKYPDADGIQVMVTPEQGEHEMRELGRLSQRGLHENVVEGQSSLVQATETSLGPDFHRVSGCSTLKMSEDMALQVARTARAKYHDANGISWVGIPVQREREVRELSSLYQRGLDTDRLMVSEDVWQKIQQGMQQLSDRAREVEREATQQAAAAELKDRRQRGEHVDGQSDRNNPEDVPMTEPKVVCPWCETEGHDVWKCLKANPATGVMEFCPLCLDKGERTEVAAHHTVDRCHESLSPDEAYKYLVLGRANMPRWMTYYQHWESVVFKRSQAGEHVVPVFPWSDEFSRGYVRRAARDYTIEFKTIEFFYEVQQQFILPEDHSQKLGEVLLRGEAQTQAQRLREQG